ncbi:SWIM zinc finger family protein [Allonocardiopsis opalescens]|uniref:SWIM zinc finger family protein n=1 Tax=Allonocardiopsis opalescens TaxID=1144618 RepID=UPI000D04BC43|nr:SWIM zinc finger family protein [Allonocardiopsis opalescens]
MTERWKTDDVLALAPDAPSRKAAEKVARPAGWPRTGAVVASGGASTLALWGECKGSGAKPYQTAVDLAGPDAPAYRCSCPSRKFPCKHAIGLLLIWSRDGLPEVAEAADWAQEWLAKRGAKAEQSAAQAPASKASAPADPEAAARRARQRAERVEAGLRELDLWLRDQVTEGLAGLRRAGYGHWNGMAARLVDAQAPGAAERVRSLGEVMAEPEWPGRLLAEYALLHLLVRAHGAGDTVEQPLRDTVRSRVGFPTSREEVLADGPRERDRWHVLGWADALADQLATRRVWLRGAASGRGAVVVSFAPAGQSLDGSLRVGTVVDAELAFYPGSGERRALVAHQYGAEPGGPPPGGPVREALGGYAEALAADPWLERWPVVLTDAVPARDGGWWLADPSGDALPLHPSASPWALLAVSGGIGVTVAGEWTPQGLHPLTVWPRSGARVRLG